MIDFKSIKNLQFSDKIDKILSEILDCKAYLDICKDCKNTKLKCKNCMNYKDLSLTADYIKCLVDDLEK